MKNRSLFATGVLSLTILACCWVLTPENFAASPLSKPPDGEDLRAVVARAAALSSTALSRVDATALSRVARVWGFVKYHHPEVASGRVDMDLELVRLLEETASGTSTLDSVLSKWIGDLGRLEPNPDIPKIPVDAHLTPDLRWIRNTNVLSADLCAALERVHAARRDGNHAYVQFAPGVGNPVFSHERAYENLRPPSDALRLLCLFRFWNIIEYYFPYRDVIGADWSHVLTEFIPRFLQADTREAYERTAIELMVRVNDSHCNLWRHLISRPPGGSCGVDARIRFIENRPVVCDLTESSPSGLRVGDVILAVDGESVGMLVERWSPFYAASNESSRLRDIAGALLSGPCGLVSVTVERDGEPRKIQIERLELNPRRQRRQNFDRGPEPLHLLSPEVAYLSLAYVKAADVDVYLQKAKGTKGLVIDIRNYPKEFMVFALGQRLVDKETPFVRFTRAIPGNPGAFAWSPPFALQPVGSRYEGRIVILVDESSMSQSEYTAMAFRSAPDAIVVGSTTTGADGNVSAIPLPGGLSPWISGIGIFYPDKRPTQRIGIVPDIEARPTLAGIRAGRDEVLERGLQEIVGAESARRIVDGR